VKGSMIERPACSVDVHNLPIQNFMPASGKPFEFHGGVTIPAIGAQATVVQFRVPSGQNGFIRRIANVFVGGGFTDFSGSIVWQIWIDSVAAGNPVVAPNFNNIIASLGSVSNPSPIDGIHIKEGKLISLIVKNISVVISGQLIGGRLGGSFFPLNLEPPDIAF
jgi:hypothetical protein